MKKDIDKKSLEYWTHFASKRRKIIRDKKVQRSYVHLIPSVKRLSSGKVIFLELGCGSASLKDIHPNYVGVFLSLSDLLSIKSRAPDFSGVCCNAESFPFKNNSIDFIFENAFLEHPVYPEKVLNECCKVIKENGIIYHNSAWFVRKWASTGIKGKSFRICTVKEKILKILFNFADNEIFRSLSIIPQRIIREIKIFFSKEPISFEYVKLKPNYSLYLGVDEDATASIDPQCLFLFYKSRGFKLLNGENFSKRIFHKGYPVIVRR